MTTSNAAFPALTCFRAIFRATNDGQLPALPTTALHGALGHALRQGACLAPARPRCRDCPAQERCAYSRLFEPALAAPSDSQKYMGVTDEAPRPLVLAPEAPLIPTGTEPHRLKVGDAVTFRVGLSAAAEDCMPVLARALRSAGRLGLGPRQARVQLDLEQVVPFVPCDAPPNERVPDHVTVELLTPLRVKLNGHIQSRVDVPAIIGAVARRAGLLASIEGRCWEPQFDLASVSAQVEASAKLHVVPVPRFSNRQMRPMTWPGVVGTIDLAGAPLCDLWPLLCFGEIAQIGKGTSFGFGRYRLLHPARQ